MPFKHYQTCPVCSGNKIHPVLEVKDHTVSKTDFAVWQCEDCLLRFTQDVPDENSIGSFYQSEDYISHTDTKKGLVNTAYHLVRKYTLGVKRKLLIEKSGKQEGMILDIGAGTGAFLDEMQTAGWQVTGLEPDPGARKLAQEKYGLEFKNPSALFELPEKKFDIVTMWHVLEHVHQLHQYIEKISSILGDDGLLVLALPNYQSGDATHYGKYWAAYDVPRHLYHFSPQSVNQLLAQHNLSLKAIQPMWFDSFYISMLSEQYKNGKNSYLKAIMNGIKSNKKALSQKESASSLIYIAGR